MAREPATAIDRRDVALAAACGLLALTAYLRTLAPGVTADVDSAMFQFLGRVLGVAHNPGYPLYALLTWPLAQIPAGSLAWRINLFSAVLGALAVGLTAITARRLGCGRLGAAFAALGLAASPTFWSQAIIAEVYTLHLVLVAALLHSALRWESSRRPRHFYAAVGWLALGLGHHLTIAAFAPALAAYALIVDRRFALRLRTMASVAAICLLGFLPYAYVLIRSRDPHAYVESPATTLDGLVQVVLGGQFRDRLFTDPWTAVVTQRIPALVTQVLQPDLTLAGLVLASIGVAWLLRRRPADAVLLLGGSAIVTAFVAGYAVVDQAVFLLPVVLCLWLLAATGLERLAALIRAGPNPRLRRAGVVAVSALAAALPIGLAAYTGPRVDRSGDRADARHIERLVAALPARAVIAGGDFIADRMVHYELLGRDAAAGRAIALAPRDAPSIAALAADGVHVVGFPSAVERLRLAGLDFSAAPMPLAEGTLDEVVGVLPRGAIVGIAIPAAHANGLRPGSRAAWQALGLPAEWGAGVSASHVAVAVVRGATPPRALSGAETVRLPFGPHEHPWSGRAGIELSADGGLAAIRAGGRDLVRTTDGVAVAIWTADGALGRAFVLQPADGYQVPLAANALTAYPMIGVAEARHVAPGAGAVDVTALASTGSLTATIPAGGALALDAEDDGVVVPYVVQQAGGARLAIEPAPPGGGPTRLTIAAAATRPAAIHVVFGAIPNRLTARLHGGSGPAQVRRAATAGLLGGPDRRSAVVRMTRDDQALLLGAGWSPVESDDAGSYRWTTGREARLVLPGSSERWTTLAIDAFLPNGAASPTLALRVAGAVLEAKPIQAGWHTYTWSLPPAVIDRLDQAPSELTLVVEGAARPRGLAVAALRFSDGP